jgi:hypothetical protein
MLRFRLFVDFSFLDCGAKQQPTIKYAIEKELQDSINFLDLSIHRSKNRSNL